MAQTPGLPGVPGEAHAYDEWLFGWDPLPGIVSVAAESSGRALVWQRLAGGITCSVDRFRPWVFAADLDDLAHLGPALASAAEPHAGRAVVRYSELDGTLGAFRYLLSGSSWQTLERAILDGVARRRGQAASSLYDLDSYYRVGLVEQYLMQTGRVYFRGLSYADVHRLQFDLETTGLDPRRERIFMIAIRDNRGLATLLEAPDAADEPQLIRRLCALIRERDPDILENHNLYGFDLPFLEQRAALLGVPLQLGRDPLAGVLERHEDPPDWVGRRRVSYSAGGRELVDTLEAVRRPDTGTRDLPSHRLKDVARHLGIAPPDRVYLEGSSIFETYCQDPELVRKYALDDVTEVDQLSQRLLRAPFALAGMAPRRYSRLVSAGPAMGVLEPLLVRAYLRARAALPRRLPEEVELGRHSGGALHLFATGVAEHVVKADVASMYPSVMRSYRIGPASDRLGVLLHLVDRLTDLRLAHKEAARTAVAGSPEEAHHSALQLAMKMLINSAYGYMGAGSMALFADRQAADEVTRRGREILEQVVNALRERGMVLIEADTDGVYFAVPAGWTLAQEQALVAQVGALLPSGIHLDYEGRYRAMYSYEVKNYALLTYAGALIVRGVALRSSRSEPFGERFLQQALRLCMQGAVPELQQLCFATVAALRERRLLAADVATRARLSKTPEEYQRSRAALREAPYEALLACGRTDWRPGERIRYYRSAVGTYCWLPDAADETPAPPAGQVDSPPPQLLAQELNQRRDYDVDYYLQLLLTSYVGRLRKAFAPEDFAQLFRLTPQLGLFDRPVEQIQPCWIR